MTRQTAQPIEHLSLNPSFVPVLQLVNEVGRGELTLDPPYQRGDQWSAAQRLGLVETWLRGLCAGVVILADRTNPAWIAAHPDRNAENTADESWSACIDGRQRITTAVMLYRSEIAIPASWLPEDHIQSVEQTDDGPYTRFDRLTLKGRLVLERRASLLVSTAKECATLADEAAMYLLVNGAGTPQSPADLANAARVAGRS